jgi:hypothetical protein
VLDTYRLDCRRNRYTAGLNGSQECRWLSRRLLLAIELYAEQKDGSIMRQFCQLQSDLTPVRWHQLVGCSDQEGKQHINRRKYAFGEIIEQDAMQPALNESAFRLGATQ